MLMKKITIKILSLLFGVLGLTQASAQCNLNAGINFTIGPNGVVNFSSTTTGTIPTTYYTWSFGDNTFGNGLAPNHTYNANGNYTVVLTAINASVNPPCQSSATVVITISSFTTTPCNLVANCTYSVGPNGTVHFMYNTSTGTVSGTTYTLYFGDNTSGNTIPTIHTYSANGSYTVTMVANNNGTNTCISTKTFVVNYTCLISSASTATMLCAGQPATLTASGSFNYMWSNGSSNAVQTVTPQLTTVYTVSNQTFPCFSTVSTITIVVNPLPPITIVPSPSALCLGQTATLTASGASTYSWSGGQQTTTISVSPLTNSNYVVSGTSVQGCIASQTLALAVLPLPSINASPLSPTLCAGSAITLSASGASSYLWKPGNATSSAVSVSPSGTGNYTVIGTDANGCSNQSVVNIVVQPCTGIEKNAGLEGKLILYPNPSQGAVTVRFEVGGEKEILVFNALGSIITKISTRADVENIDLTEAGKGIYFIKVKADNLSGNYRIIVQ